MWEFWSNGTGLEAPYVPDVIFKFGSRESFVLLAGQGENISNIFLHVQVGGTVSCCSWTVGESFFSPMMEANSPVIGISSHISFVFPSMKVLFSSSLLSLQMSSFFSELSFRSIVWSLSAVFLEPPLPASLFSPIDAQTDDIARTVLPAFSLSRLLRPIESLP